MKLELPYDRHDNIYILKLLCNNLTAV